MPLSLSIPHVAKRACADAGEGNSCLMLPRGSWLKSVAWCSFPSQKHKTVARVRSQMDGDGAQASGVILVHHLDTKTLLTFAIYRFAIYRFS